MRTSTTKKTPQKEKEKNITKLKKRKKKKEKEKDKNQNCSLKIKIGSMINQKLHNFRTGNSIVNRGISTLLQTQIINSQIKKKTKKMKLFFILIQNN